MTKQDEDYKTRRFSSRENKDREQDGRREDRTFSSVRISGNSEGRGRRQAETKTNKKNAATYTTQAHSRHDSRDAARRRGKDKKPKEQQQQQQQQQLPNHFLRSTRFVLFVLLSLPSLFRSADDSSDSVPSCMNCVCVYMYKTPMLLSPLLTRREEYLYPFSNCLVRV